MSWLFLLLTLAVASLVHTFTIDLSDEDTEEVEALLANNSQLFPLDLMEPSFILPGRGRSLQRSFRFSFSDLLGLLRNKTALTGNSQLFSLDMIRPSSSLLPGPPSPPSPRSLPATARSSWDCGCGLAPAAGRIVGGAEVAPMHSRPYQVYLQSCSLSGCSMCGATLLNKRYVLTAMHCVTGATNLVVGLGEHNIRQSIESHSVQTIRVASVVRRADYSESDVNNDIALLKLEKVGGVVPWCPGLISLPSGRCFLLLCYPGLPAHRPGPELRGLHWVRDGVGNHAGGRQSERRVETDPADHPGQH